MTFVLCLYEPRSLIHSFLNIGDNRKIRTMMADTKIIHSAIRLELVLAASANLGVKEINLHEAHVLPTIRMHVSPCTHCFATVTMISAAVVMTKPRNGRESLNGRTQIVYMSSTAYGIVIHNTFETESD